MVPDHEFERRFGLPRLTLIQLSRKEREAYALRNQKQVFYGKEEAAAARLASNEAVLRAVPVGYSLERLNGINIGAGKRPISRFLAPVDITRKHGEGDLTNAILSPMMPLPFRENVLDVIISVHSLEHVPNPIEVVLHWLDIIKPGGGIGVILPDWRYNWDARKDPTLWGHKWNSEPDLVQYFYSKYWKKYAKLERINTLDYKIGFDFILRKNGRFRAFEEKDHLKNYSGRMLFEEGRMAGQNFRK